MLPADRCFQLIGASNCPPGASHDSGCHSPYASLRDARKWIQRLMVSELAWRSQDRFAFALAFAPQTVPLPCPSPSRRVIISHPLPITRVYVRTQPTTIYELVLRLNRFTASMLLVVCRVTLRQIGRLGAVFALGLLNDYCIRRRLITIVSMKLNHFYRYIKNMIQKGSYISEPVRFPFKF